MKLTDKGIALIEFDLMVRNRHWLLVYYPFVWYSSVGGPDLFHKGNPIAPWANLHKQTCGVYAALEHPIPPSPYHMGNKYSGRPWKCRHVDQLLCKALCTNYTQLSGEGYSADFEAPSSTEVKDGKW